MLCSHLFNEINLQADRTDACDSLCLTNNPDRRPFVKCVVSHSDAPELNQVFHAGAGWTQRCGVHQRGGGVGLGRAGAL